MNVEEMEYESDSDDVGEDLDIDRLPEEANQDDSDEELRVALATGLIQPGSKVNLVPKAAKPKVNNVEALKQKLSVLKNSLEWSERLDLTVEMNELAEDGTNPLLKDDFAREAHFEKVAQEGARRGVIMAKRLNLPLLRPKDYFAQMAKSDEHMGRVKSNLLTQKDKIDKRDQARQLRNQKKFAKDVQKKAKLKKQEDRRVAKEEIKMIRKKGESGILPQGVKKSPMKKGGRMQKREMKNAKFGFGGKKEKRNSAESHFGGPQKRGPGAKGIRKPQKRLGKNRRAQQRNTE